ncbi:MAG: hypothetical protein DMG05_04230 [Acidobacteria bacterium]|nr:MAG: hypothetical protein DMG05_04230 [Acidobacteriota bacterium]
MKQIALCYFRIIVASPCGRFQWSRQKPLDRFMKPKIRWNFEMVLGLLIFLVLGLYYVLLFFLFLLIRYL